MAGERVDPRQFFATLRGLFAGAVRRVDKLETVQAQHVAACKVFEAAYKAALADQFLSFPDGREVNTLRAQLANLGTQATSLVTLLDAEDGSEQLITALESVFPPDAPEWDLPEPVLEESLLERMEREASERPVPPPVPAPAEVPLSMVTARKLVTLKGFQEYGTSGKILAVLARLLFRDQDFVCEDFSLLVSQLINMDRPKVSNNMGYLARRAPDKTFLRVDLTSGQVMDLDHKRGQFKYRLITTWATWADEQLSRFNAELKS